MQETFADDFRFLQNNYEANASGPDEIFPLCWYLLVFHCHVHKSGFQVNPVMAISRPLERDIIFINLPNGVLTTECSQIQRRLFQSSSKNAISWSLTGLDNLSRIQEKVPNKNNNKAYV